MLYWSWFCVPMSLLSHEQISFPVPAYPVNMMSKPHYSSPETEPWVYTSVNKLLTTVSSLADLCSLLTAPEAQVGTVHLSVCPVQFHCHATVAWGKLWKVQNRVRLHTTTHRGVCPCQGASQNAHLPTGKSVPVRVQPRHTITHRGACTQQDAGYIRAEKFSPFFILHSLFPSPSISS